MSPDIILALIILVPIVLLTFLRVNGTLVFLSACLGLVLVQYVGREAADFIDLFLPSLSPNNLKIFLYALPVILTIVFMIRTIPTKGKLFFNLLPVTGFSLLTTLVVIPLLPGNLTGSLFTSFVWDQLEQLQTIIVSTSALICLVALWTQRPKHHHDGKHHGKHHSKRHI